MGSLAKRVRYLRSFLRRDLVHLNLQILYQCNYRCRICDFWKEPYSGMSRMTAADAAVMSEKLRAIGPLIVSIGGGEPLLHPELAGIIRTLARFHFPVMICNGWFITPENAREMFEAGLCEVSISLDYADPERHDRQRGVEGAFDRAVLALETLRRNRVLPHQRVHMISVVMDDNLDEIEPLILLAREIGVTYLVTMYSHGRGRREDLVPDRDISAHLLGLKNRYPEFVAVRGYLGRFSEAAANEQGVLPCYAGRNLFNIDCQGNVTPCIDRLDKVAGNILTDYLTDIRQALLRGQEENDCGGCWTSCRGNIESLMYGRGKLGNLIDLWRMTRDVPLEFPSVQGA